MQVNLTQRELSEVSANLQGCIRDQRRAQLTKAEVDSLGDTARYNTCYILYIHTYIHT
jgi:hypothetical protein